MPRMVPVPADGNQQAAERLDEGGFSRAVGAKEAEDLAFADGEADIVDSSELTETNGELIGARLPTRHCRRTVADMPDLSVPWRLST